MPKGITRDELCNFRCKLHHMPSPKASQLQHFDSQLKQFFTPAPIAHFMASLFSNLPPRIRLLDAGAGHGALTAVMLERSLLESVNCLQASLYIAGAVLHQQNQIRPRLFCQGF